MNQREIIIKSTADGSQQPFLFYKSEKEGKRPLLVGLHTWSFDRFNQIENMLPLAEKHGFSLLLPEFRGKNLKTNPDCKNACGSMAAKQDILDAINYVILNEDADKENVFLLGASGGGHMALLMAGFCPEVFRAVGAFVPITNLESWTEQNDYYKEHVYACCGSSEEMANRSPVSYIDSIAKSNTKIFHGKYDPVVPVSHSISFYNTLSEKYPSARVYLDIFDGGHEMDMVLAEHWLIGQYKKEKKKEVTG